MESHESTTNAFGSLSDRAKSLWAKASNEEGSESWLPLVIHMSDSANVARSLWREWVPCSTKKLIVRDISGLAEEDDLFEYGEKLLVFLAASHDIGKATPAFQNSQSLRHTNSGLALERRGAIENAGLRFYDNLLPPNRIHHSLASEMILEKNESNRFDRSVAIVLGGHHGRPPSKSDQEIIQRTDSYHSYTGFKDKAWCNVQEELLEYAASLSDSSLSKLHRVKIPITAQVILTGLVIMADWIASDESRFPYIEEPYCTKDALVGRASHAWEELKLPKKWEAGDYWRSYDLFKERFNISARPVQRTVEQVAKNLETPGIMIIEAPMGEGKTEAALVAAEIFAEKLGMGGLFFALPTQATADGIFTRIKDWIDSASEYDEYRSLFLAHGKSAFNKEYSQIKRHTNNVYGIDNTGRSKDHVVTREWFEGRKKGLLSDFVIGTVDQVLMCGLRQKHQAMRHLALANKVVIVDEVHAYDAYMGSYLVKALQWLGAYNVPVILLSATLPQSRREDLIYAYLNVSLEEENPQPPESWVSNRSYPIVTFTDNRDVKQASADISSRNRTVEVIKITDDSLYDMLDDLTAGGGYVGIIVNTVKKAQIIAKVLAEKYGEESTYILHSHFISIDRTHREKEVREILSKKRRAPPHRAFVVGTQVMEQSLDLDFDLLITDLCPMDLLLQRIGRLHRHDRSRPEKLKEPRCFVLDPEDGSFDGGSEAIYLKYHLMTARHLLPKSISLPGDICDLVQSAYCSDGIDVPSEKWGEYQEAKKMMISRLNEKEDKATAFQIKEPKQGMYGLIGWLDRGKEDNEKVGEATVRDTDGSLEVIFIQERNKKFFMLPLDDEMGGKEIPNVPSQDVCFTLAGCKAALPRTLSAPWQLEKTIRALEEDNIVRGLPKNWQESSWLAGELFLVLDENNTAVLCGKKLTYSNKFGLYAEDV